MIINRSLTMKKTFWILGLMLGLLCLSQSLYAQAAMNQVTLSAAVTSTDATTVSLSVADSVSAGDVIYVDQEAMIANTCSSANDTCTVRRGQLGTRAEGHLNRAIVWTGVATRFYYYDPYPGARCVNANAYPGNAEPWINILTGNISVCSQTFGTGSTVAGYWARANLGMGSSASMLPYRPIFYPTSRTSTATVITPALTVNLWDYLIASLTYSGPFEVFLPNPTGLLGKRIVVSDFARLNSNAATSTAGRTITIRGLFDTDTSVTLANWQQFEEQYGATTERLQGVGATTSFYVGITASSMMYWMASPW